MRTVAGRMKIYLPQTVLGLRPRWCRYEQSINEAIVAYSVDLGGDMGGSDGRSGHGASDNGVVVVVRGVGSEDDQQWQQRRCR